MSVLAQTLKEIAIDKAKKRPELVDYLLEETPVLAKCKWIAASHGLWNVEEVLDDVEGPAFVDLGAPLPEMQVRTKLQQTYVSVMGGEVEASKDKVDQFGGAGKYFARRERPLLRKAGMDTELALYESWWKKGAKKAGNVTNCGGATAKKQSSMLIVRMDEELNMGLYDPTAFNRGYLLDIKPINGGQEYHLRSQEGVLGYGVSYRGRFGWQLLNPARTCYHFANIEGTEHIPTEAQIQDAIAVVRGTPSNTMIIAHPRTLGLVFGSLKLAKLEYMGGETSLNAQVQTYYGIPVLGSYNFPFASEAVVA